MRVLGIDTATSTASAAIVENGHIIAEELSSSIGSADRGHSPNPGGNHAEIILPLIQSVLQSAAISVADLGALAVSIGPGSFTGLRIGLSTIKGIAYGWGIPVAGVSTLLANAARVTDFEGLICSILDARKKQVYVALFRRRDEQLARLTDDSIQTAGEVADLVRNFNGDNASRCVFIGDATTPYEKLLREEFDFDAILVKGDALPTVASAVARIGETQCCAGVASDARPNLAPVYLRPSEAEIKQKKIS